MSLIKTWLLEEQNKYNTQPVFPVTLKDLNDTQWDLILTPDLQQNDKELFESLLYTRCLAREERQKKERA